MTGFDLNLLPVALAIHEERSVSGAARKLGMSQPAVSVALNKLRRALGDPLFVRTAHGMEPTPRALALVSPTRDILHRLQTGVLASVEFDPATTERKFTVALSDIGEMTILPRLLDRLRRDAPRASICSVTMAPARTGSRSTSLASRLASRRRVCSRRQRRLACSSSTRPVSRPRAHPLPLSAAVCLGSQLTRLEGVSFAALGAKFAPYMEETMGLELKNLTFFFDDSVRQSAEG